MAKRRNKHTNRVIVIIASLALVIGLVPATALAAGGLGGDDKGPDREAPLIAGTADATSAAYPTFKQSKAVGGVTVAVEAEAGAFPEGARLSVAAVPSSRTEAAVAPERGAGENVAASYTFDIKMLGVDGAELQPANGNLVRVSFAAAEVADPNLDVSVYHVSGGEAEELAVSESGTTATATSGGFSYYTVEFTYGELQYVLQGGESVPLADVLATVGLQGEPEYVEVSDPELFSASDKTGEWMVTSHKAFSSDEWMRVTIAGRPYRIVVTDDEKTYNVWIAGTQVTSSNADDLSKIKGVKVAEGGSASYDPINNVLNLNNTTITYSGSGGVGYGIKYDDYQGFTISVSGKCAIVDGGEWTRESYGIYLYETVREAEQTTIKIEKGASMTVTAGDVQDTTRSSWSVGIFNPNLKGGFWISNNGTFTVNSGSATNSYGIDHDSFRDLIIIGPGVTSVSAGEATETSAGIRGGGCLFVQYGTVNASAQKATGDGGKSFGIGGFSILSINGSVTAWTTADVGEARALDINAASAQSISLGNGYRGFGSTSGDGSNPEIFNKSANWSYRWFKANSGLALLTYDANNATPGTAWKASEIANSGSNLSAVLGETVPETLNGSVATAPVSMAFGGYEVAAGDGEPAVFELGDTVDYAIAGDTTVKYLWYEVHDVAVEGGTTQDSPACKGRTVTVTADAPAPAMLFDKWTTTSDGVAFADAADAETTFVMPAHEVAVTANFKEKAKVDVVVNRDGQSQDGLAKYLRLVTADGADTGVVFERSLADGEYIYVYDPATTKGSLLSSGNYVLKFDPPASSGYTASSEELGYYEDAYQETTTFDYHTIEFVNYDGTVLQGGAYTAGEQPKYDGDEPTKPATAQCEYVFAGWEPEVVAVAGKAIYKATFTETAKKGVYEVVSGAGGTWEEGSGDPLVFTFERTVNPETAFDHFTGIEVDSKAVSEKDASGKTNYTAKRGSVIVALHPSFLATLSEGNHTVTALFDDGNNVDVAFALAAGPAPAVKHTVTFDANGHGKAPDAQTVEHGKKAKKPASPTASGYTFGGWYKDEACKEAYDFSAPVTEDVTLYAKWTKKSSSGSGTSPKTGDPLAGAFATALALAAASALALALSRRRSRD